MKLVKEDNNETNTFLILFRAGKGFDIQTWNFKASALKSWKIKASKLEEIINY